MNFIEIEKEILRNRGDKTFMDGVIEKVTPLIEKYDWQMNKFLETHCRGETGLKNLELDNSNPIHRYYQYKCQQYNQVERIIRVAKAFS